MTFDEWVHQRMPFLASDEAADDRAIAFAAWKAALAQQPPSAPVVGRALEYLRPHLEAGTFSAPDWAIQLASILTGGDGCGKPQPAAVDGEVEGLPRYGFPDGNEPRPVPCADGYWTPWHLAQQPAPSAPVGVAKAWQQGYHQGILDERISEANIGIAGFAAKVEPARTNPYLAQQPAAVADATVARLTKDQRTRLVEKLVADQVEGADRLSSYLWSVLKNGFRGYSSYTDQELLDAHWDAFDEDFFGLESGDDR